METLPSVEAIGVSVEEAIGRGLDALNATRSQVGVDVIDPGGGKNMARVRVTLLGSPPAAMPPAMPAAAPATTSAPVTPDEMKIAADVLAQLLKHMHVKAEVEARQATAEDEHDLEAPGGLPFILNIKGDDLGILIGRRGETLRDLQYIARLIATKQIGQQVNVVVDVKVTNSAASRRCAARRADGRAGRHHAQTGRARTDARQRAPHHPPGPARSSQRHYAERRPG